MDKLTDSQLIEFVRLAINALFVKMRGNMPRRNGVRLASLESESSSV